MHVVGRLLENLRGVVLSALPHCVGPKQAWAQLKGIIQALWQLDEHIRELWSERIQQAFSWELGRIACVLPEFEVVRVEPLGSNEAWIYVSRGAWRVLTPHGNRVEFVVTSPL